MSDAEAELARVREELRAVSMQFENANGSRLFQTKRADGLEAALHAAEQVVEAARALDAQLAYRSDWPAHSNLRAALAGLREPPHEHRFVDKALLHEPPLRVCECGLREPREPCAYCGSTEECPKSCERVALWGAKGGQ